MLLNIKQLPNRYATIPGLRGAIRAFCSSPEDITIPQRINRSPTCILRALEATLTCRDPTAAHYKYQDDPYMIPTSNITKRVYAMSQESGRKAAHWVRAQNPTLFQHKEACPEIPAFLSHKVYSDDVTEADLKETINAVRVTEAVQIYNALINKKLTLSDETLEDFLELLCYCNSSDILSDELIEERWFRQSGSGREKVRKTWLDNGTAEEVFAAMKSPSARSYSALIRGMCKFHQGQRAYELFTAANAKNITIVDTDVYNGLISCANFLRENYETRWRFIVDLLGVMRDLSVGVNVRTLNAILGSLSMMGTSDNTRRLVLRTLREMRMCGVEPTLGSWYHVLVAYCKPQGKISTILHDILPLLEHNHHTIHTKDDVNFFVTAMDICANHLQDKQLALRLHALLMHKNNYDLIGDSYKESIYYRNYVTILCIMEPLAAFMHNTYNTLVPHIYIPEPSVMEEILKAVEINDATAEYLPQLWSDMKVFDHAHRERLLDIVLALMVNAKGGDGGGGAQFGAIAWDVWEKIEMQPDTRIKKLSFTGDMLGKIMTLVLRNGDFEKAREIMHKLDSSRHLIAGIPQIEPMQLFIDRCIVEKQPSLAINCIQYCSECGFVEAEQFGRKLTEELTLDEGHLGKLSKIVGEKNLKKNYV